jgi:hypothetical protein
MPVFAVIAYFEACPATRQEQTALLPKGFDAGLMLCFKPVLK